MRIEDFHLKLNVITPEEMLPGDVVQPATGVRAWSAQVVKYTTQDRVYFFRPYVRHEELIGGQFACMIGTENFSVPKNISHTYFLLERKDES